MKEQDFDIDKALDSIKEYIDAYKQQQGYKEYLLETFIDDIIYGLGISISDEFKHFNGYQKFQKVLMEYFKNRRLRLDLD